LGAGWHEEEFKAYGIPFEAPATRLRRLREYAEIIRALWTQQSVDYQGEFYVLRNAFCSPKPLQSPPRIWLGTLGEKIGLPLAGEVGDAWNCSLQSPESFKRKRDLVLTHARDVSTFLTSINIPFVPALGENFEKELRERFALRWEAIKDLTLTGSSQRMIDMLAPYVEAGADYIILSIRAPFDHEGLAQFAEEVIPALTRRTQIAM
jgi:alkanesulfonate monooxygenase SsuD/methylene tetrahydromethanopterin reductase-like flavin-dependent oxidoreductase (luciferase family)